jgi:methionine synthase (B12-dependent) (EC 2.1.1.13)
MLDMIINEKWLTANSVICFMPANSEGDDIILFDDDSRSKAIGTIHCLRQQNKKSAGLSNFSLADFIAPIDSGVKDYIGGFVVTTGIGIEEKLEEFKLQHDDYNSILLKALADRLAEAFAELMHSRVRNEFWGYAKGENFSNEELILEKYRGIRPAPGYPACPDHNQKRILFEMLKETDSCGVKLTDALAMYPASSVSGFYFAHPEAKYFGLGKIGKDQVENYAKRKGLSVTEVERWLAPALNYK